MAKFFWCCFVVLCMPVAVLAAPQEVATQAQLAAMQSNGAYVLAADIVINGNWEPLGSDAAPFGGTLDGRGFRISRLSDSLFDTLEGAAVRDVHLEGLIQTDGVLPVGLLARVAVDATIQSVTATGEIFAPQASAAGGLLGVQYGGLAANSRAAVDVYGGNAVGGFAGQLLEGARVFNASAYGNVHAQWAVGGFVGVVGSGVAVEHAFSAGNVRGQTAVGGFAGALENAGTLYGCLSFSHEVVGEKQVHRLVGEAAVGAGITHGYAYLGMRVANHEGLRHVSPRNFGPDGADINRQNLHMVLRELGWPRLSQREG